MLRRVSEFDLSGECQRLGVDLPKVLSVYNFHFWFNGSSAKIVLSLEPPAVASVGIDGLARVYAGEGLDRAELEERLVSVLGLREDPAEFYRLARSDPLLAPFASEWAGWRLRGTGLWWALVTAVCQQNASFRQGWRMLAKLVNRYGRGVELEGEGWVPLPPSPRDVLSDPSKLREAGLGYRADTVVRIAERFVRGEVPDEGELARMEAGEAERSLKTVRGVGSYTARLALALSARRYELPPIDRWVRALASRAYGVSGGEVESAWVNRWGRWSALAVVALTVALDAAPLREALARLEAGRLLPEPGKLSPSTLWSFALC